MKVRVYDKCTGGYLKSEVYAILNRGIYERYLVLVPDNRPYLRFFDYCDRSTKAPYPTYIDTILSGVPEGWIRTESLDKLKALLPKPQQNIKLDCFRGYPWIFENQDLLVRLICGHSIFFDETDFTKVNSNLEDWNYVETPQDAETLLMEFHGFHDSVLKSLHYISGSRILDNGSMIVTDPVKQVSMIFNSQWAHSIEMLFESVIAVNLRPAQADYMSDIFSATIIVENESIFFCDGEVGKEQKDFEGTWVKAYSLRWRYLDKTSYEQEMLPNSTVDMVKGPPRILQSTLKE